MIIRILQNLVKQGLKIEVCSLLSLSADFGYRGGERRKERGQSEGKRIESSTYK